MRVNVVSISIVIVCLAAAVPPAGATCGSANCFLFTGTQEGVVSPGRFTLDFSFRSIRQDKKLSGRDSVAEVLTPGIDFENGVVEPDHHREIETENQLFQVDLSYGITERITVAAGLPIVNDRVHSHYEDVGSAEEHFTNAAGTSGFGDVRLGVRATLWVAKQDLIVGGLALKVPTGAYRKLDEEGAIGEPSIMPGTGSLDWIASLHYSHHYEKSHIEWFSSGSYRLNTENDLDYRFGDESVLSTGLMGSPNLRLTWSLQANARFSGRDEYRSSGLASTGSTLVNLTPGVTLHADGDLAFYAHVQVPVYQDVNEAQLAPRTGLLLGLSKSF